MERKGIGQEGKENCLVSGQGPNWTAQPLVIAVVIISHISISTLAYKLMPFICIGSQTPIAPGNSSFTNVNMNTTQIR
jgi:hypothetical protein